MVNLDELRELVRDWQIACGADDDIACMHKYDALRAAAINALPKLLAELQAGRAVVTAATGALWEDPGNESHDRLDTALAAYDKAVRNVTV